ncbi:MAG: HAD family phosphatase [Acidobacteria bacterium]|nr:HAD family phosphatase [Acidobacteriota bacterium]
MLKALIFDLGNVILAFDFKRSYRALSAVCGYSPEQMPERLRATDLVTRYESGAVTSEAFFDELVGILELDGLSYESFQEIWFSIFDREPLCPDSFFEHLARDYRLILLSNTNPLHFDRIRKHFPLLRHFHGLVLSHEVGAMKPAPQIYEEAIRLAGCRPEECFYTDDIQTYVDGGKRAGLDAVQFHSYEQIRGELIARGVKL